MAKYVNTTDYLILEDELQRILLIGKIDVGQFVTGVVVALLGYEDDSGKFFVEEACSANMPLAMNSDLQLTHELSSPRWMLRIFYILFILFSIMRLK